MVMRAPDYLRSVCTSNVLSAVGMLTIRRLERREWFSVDTDALSFLLMPSSPLLGFRDDDYGFEYFSATLQ